MRRTTGVPVECASCGKTSGHYEVDGDLRCDECGQFASETDKYCVEHDVDIERLPSTYSRCPRCDERRRVEAMEQERMARRADPNMHPTIDAPRR